MTEAEWMEGGYLPDRLDQLRGGSGRKLRLLACALCRAEPVWRRLTDTASWRLVDVSERFADGLATRAELLAAAGDAPEGLVVRGYRTATRRPDHLSLNGQAKRASQATANDNPWEAARQAALMSANLLSGHAADLVRDVFGNPFVMSGLNSAQLTPAVVAMARRMYDSRAFEGMRELGDLLERTNCASRDALDHCRGPGPHVRGCWVLDLILGKT